MASHDQRETIAYRILDKYVVLVAFAIYGLASLPVYFWIVGSVGDAGTIEGGVVMASLITGSLMFVPAIMSWLRKKKFELGYAQAEGDSSLTEGPV